MSEVTQSKQASLKDLLAGLREINSILDGTEEKLNYLAHNTPRDEKKENDSPSGENASLDALNSIVNSIRRKSNNIAKHTNIVTGN